LGRKNQIPNHVVIPAIYPTKQMSGILEKKIQKEKQRVNVDLIFDTVQIFNFFLIDTKVW